VEQPVNETQINSVYRQLLKKIICLALVIYRTEVKHRPAEIYHKTLSLVERVRTHTNTYILAINETLKRAGYDVKKKMLYKATA